MRGAIQRAGHEDASSDQPQEIRHVTFQHVSRPREYGKRPLPRMGGTHSAPSGGVSSRPFGWALGSDDVWCPALKGGSVPKGPVCGFHPRDPRRVQEDHSPGLAPSPCLSGRRPGRVEVAPGPRRGAPKEGLPGVRTQALGSRTPCSRRSAPGLQPQPPAFTVLRHAPHSGAPAASPRGPAH